jgi:uncharacterized protein YlxW (UPF0749 family)
MPVEVMFVAMTAIICTFLVIRMGIRHAERKVDAVSSADSARLETILTETEKEVAQLRERVQVLEKLVTDDDRRLATEIERLRSEARR